MHPAGYPPLEPVSQHPHVVTWQQAQQWAMQPPADAQLPLPSQTPALTEGMRSQAQVAPQDFLNYAEPRHDRPSPVEYAAAPSNALPRPNWSPLRYLRNEGDVADAKSGHLPRAAGNWSPHEARGGYEEPTRGAPPRLYPGHDAQFNVGRQAPAHIAAYPPGLEHAQGSRPNVDYNYDFDYYYG